MTNNLISIVMPTFNSAAFISDALESLKHQTNQNFELLVCDGGSTDDTLDIVLEKMGDRVNIVSRSDSGIPDALNKGFSAAKGEILCWLNSDDVIATSTALMFVADYFMTRSCDVAVCDCVALTKDGRVSKTLIAFSPPPEFAAFGGNIFTGSLFFSKLAWKKFGGFSRKYELAFEYELTDSIFSEFKVHKINGVVGGFRIHESGLSSAFRSKLSEEKQLIRLNTRTIGKLRYFAYRILQHARDQNIHRVIFNRFFDPNLGLQWTDVERKGWSGQASKCL